MTRTRSGGYLGIIAPTILLVMAMGHADRASAATITVTNCNDNGTGSLRSAVFRAASGDTIDLTHLACSRIALTSGQIVINQNDLTLVGRSRYALTIDGNQRDRVFWHQGTGTLQLVRLSVAYGSRNALVDVYDAGGCVLSDGNVELRFARAHHCMVFVNGFLEVQGGFGGAVQAAGHVLAYYSSVFDNMSGWRGAGGGIGASDVTLYRSQVYNNTAYMGGGIALGGRFKATYSIIQNNHASWAGGGVLDLGGPLLLNKTTVSGNVADGSRSYDETLGGGGITAWGGPNLIVDSTISGNLSDIDAAASFARSVEFLNSTVAYNVDRFEQDISHPGCEGVLNAASLQLESTIVARNPCQSPGLAAVDIGTRTTSVVGRDNLIEHAQVPVPTDTLTANPRLGPLAWNGGPTRTHMPASDSPVLEHGSNLLNRKYDQRGPGFPRVKGAFPDIGAVER